MFTTLHISKRKMKQTFIKNKNLSISLFGHVKAFLYLLDIYTFSHFKRRFLKYISVFYHSIYYVLHYIFYTFGHFGFSWLS